jgi:hypothetical protein
MVHSDDPPIERPTIQPTPPPIKSLLPPPFSAPPVPRTAAVLQLDPYSMVAFQTFAGRGLREARCLGKGIRESVNVEKDMQLQLDPRLAAVIVDREDIVAILARPVGQDLADIGHFGLPCGEV